MSPEIQTPRPNETETSTNELEAQHPSTTIEVDEENFPEEEITVENKSDHTEPRVIGAQVIDVAAGDGTFHIPELRGLEPATATATGYTSDGKANYERPRPVGHLSGDISTESRYHQGAA